MLRVYSPKGGDELRTVNCSGVEVPMYTELLDNNISSTSVDVRSGPAIFNKLNP